MNNLEPKKNTMPLPPIPKDTLESVFEVFLYHLAGAKMMCEAMGDNPRFDNYLDRD